MWWCPTLLVADSLLGIAGDRVERALFALASGQIAHTILRRLAQLTIIRQGARRLRVIFLSGVGVPVAVAGLRLRGACAWRHCWCRCSALPAAYVRVC